MNDFQIIIDTREQTPYHFQNAIQGTLKTGDYSIVGFENLIAIERKTLGDAYSTFTFGHERFKKELERSKELLVFEIVVEASPFDFVHPFESRHNFTHPNSLIGMVKKWRREYNVNWVFLPIIDDCKRYIYWRLKRFYDEYKNGLW